MIEEGRAEGGMRDDHETCSRTAEPFESALSEHYILKFTVEIPARPPPNGAVYQAHSPPLAGCLLPTLDTVGFRIRTIGLDSDHLRLTPNNARLSHAIDPDHNHNRFKKMGYD